MFHAVDLCIGRVRARLSYIVVLSGAVFAALSGSSLANTGMMGSAMVPEMLKRGYKPHMGFGPVLGAGGLAVIIPPSSLAVLLGSLAQIDVGALLIAGFIPGLLLTAMYIGSDHRAGCDRSRRRAHLRCAAAPRSPRRCAPSCVNVVPMGVIVFLVVGTIILGIASPTESAALGCIGVMGLTLAYRRFSWALVWKSLDDAMKVTGMTLLIIAASTTFAQALAYSGASNGMIQWFLSFDLKPLAMLLVMIGIILLLGMFMDQLSMMLITLPVFIPIAKTARLRSGLVRPAAAALLRDRLHHAAVRPAAVHHARRRAARARR